MDLTEILNTAVEIQYGMGIYTDDEERLKGLAELVQELTYILSDMEKIDDSSKNK